MDEERENVIEFLADQRNAYVTFTQQKFINRIKMLAEKSDKVVILDESKSHIYAKVPTSWVKINPPKTVSEETKAKARERALKLLADKDSTFGKKSLKQPAR